MGNGLPYTYEVMTNVRYDESTIPIEEVVWPSARPSGEEWITLITCGGRTVYAPARASDSISTGTWSRPAESSGGI